MSGFTKLVPEIVQSSIWNESAEIRCVWIAMIATKDKDGNIRGNRLALARLANVPVESVDAALEKFQSPDLDSNNQDNEGRRIEQIPGGWHIISHSVYRAKDYREHEAERKKAYREKKAMSGTCPGQVPDSSVSVSVSSSESVNKGDARGKQCERSTTVQLPFNSPAFIESWNGYVDHRKKMKAPMTDRAKTLALNKLPKTESEAIRWIDNATEKGWRGIYEPGESRNSKQKAFQHI